MYSGMGLTRVMESKLLDWATKSSNSLSEQDLSATQARIKSLDPEIVEAILGKDDAVVMRECVDKLGCGLSDEAIYFDRLEQLVESVDNAQNMARMGLWQSILKTITANEENAHLALSVVGTAAQNNAQVQYDLEHLNALNLIVPLMKSKDRSVSLKAIYACSAIVQNNHAAFITFMNLNGPEHLRAAQKSFPEKATHRVQHLIEQLCIQFPEYQAELQ